MNEAGTLGLLLRQCGSSLLQLNYITAIIRLLSAAGCGALMGPNRGAVLSP